MATASLRFGQLMTTLPPSLEDAARASADPAAVRVLFERIREERPDDFERLDEPLARDMAAVAGASRSLARLLAADREALVSLTPGRPFGDHLSAVRAAAGADEIARRQHLALLRIAADDLAGRSALEEVGARLSELADAVLAAAVEVARPTTSLAVIAMGKHGAEELNYASDVDVLFVTANDAELAAATSAARRVLGIAGTAYRIDTGLRPEGRNGVLVRTLDSYVAYWEKWARPWEFQALMKARASAGDAALGGDFEEQAANAVWSRHLDSEALGELRSMKSRAESMVAAKGLSERELKRGRGGIRDIEFAAQLLQLVHGGNDPALRVRPTLAALAELGSAGYVDAADATALSLAYRFLRTVEHRLQLVEEAQVHTVPPDGPARDHLAAVLGFAMPVAVAPVAPIAADLSRAITLPARRGGVRRRSDRMDLVLSRYQSSVRSIHERLFFRPLLEVFGPAARSAGGTGARLSEAAAAERLSAFGFREAERTRQALGELTRGLTRSSRLMQQLLPVLLGWLSETPDPDLGLLALRNLAGMPHQRDVLVASFRDSPELARRLCFVLGTSRRLGELAQRHPALALRVGDDDELAPPSTVELATRAVAAAGLTPERAVRGLRRVVGEETLRIAAADLLLGRQSAGRELARLGDAALTAALHATAPRLPFGIVAMGRLGGRELAYGSDLDVVLVYDGSTSGDAAAAEEAAAALLRLLNGSTPSERIWTVDASLRPEGKQGPLARSLAAYEEYHARWGSAWERQALIRARPVAGDTDLLDQFMALVERTVWERPLALEDLREVRRLKARTERERIPSGEDPQFHFKLGKGSLADIEWTTQLLQLEHRVRGTNTREALRALLDARVIDEGDVGTLTAALTFLEDTRNRWHLVGNYVAGAGGPVTRTGSDSLPHAPDALARLARSLGDTPAELREQYRRLTRRARKVVERRFYGL
jgi:glutamate-ammonia-ligase adenylyltransferase